MLGLERNGKFFLDSVERKSINPVHHKKKSQHGEFSALSAPV